MPCVLPASTSPAAAACGGPWRPHGAPCVHTEGPASIISALRPWCTPKHGRSMSKYGQNPGVYIPGIPAHFATARAPQRPACAAGGSSALRCVMGSPTAIRRAQWHVVAAGIGARSPLRPLVYGDAGGSAAVGAGRCVSRTQAHAASTSEYFWVYLQVVVRLSVRYLEVNPQGLRYTQSGLVLWHSGSNARRLRPGPGIPPGYIVPIAKRSLHSLTPSVVT